MKSILSTLFILLLLNLAPKSGFAQLSGSYTIDPSGSGNFLSVSEAFAAVQSAGLSGPVILSVVPGTYTVHDSLYNVPGLSAVNSLALTSATGNPADVVFSYTATSLKNNFILRLKRVDGVKIGGIHFLAQGNLYQRAIEIADSTTNTTLDGNIFEGSNQTFSDDSRTLVYISGTHSHSALIQNNQFLKSGYALKLSGWASVPGSTIKNNTITGSWQGIFTSNVNNLTVTGNTISAGIVGIDIESSTGTLVVSENAITINSQNASGTNCYGLIINNFSGATTGNFVTNNTAEILPTTTNGFCFSLTNSSWQTIAFNTLVSQAGGGAALYLTGSHHTVLNNIGVAASGYYAYYVSYSSGVPVDQSDYNNWISTGGTGFYWQNQPVATLAGFKSKSGHDVHSLSVNPVLTAMESHLNLLDGRAVPVAGITTDKKGNTRDGSTPDPGAFEFTGSRTPYPGGSYVVGSGGVFTTPQAAADSLMKNGILDAVWLEIEPGTYNGQLVLAGTIPGASPDKKVIFTRTPSDTSEVKLTWTATGSADNYLVKLTGSDFLTFDHLTFESLNASYSRVFLLSQANDSIEISYCRFLAPAGGSEDANTSLIYQNSAHEQQALRILNNHLTGGSCGINLSLKISQLKTTPGYLIFGNTVSASRTGIQVWYTTNLTISKNTVTPGGTGILVNTSDGLTTVDANRITMTNPVSYTKGISVQYLTGSATFISNNLVSGTSLTQPATGLYLSNSDHITVAYNSIWLEGASPVNGGSECIYLNGGSDQKFYNNIAFNMVGGYVLNFAEYNSPTVVAGSDYNNFGGNGAYLFAVSGKVFQTVYQVKQQTTREAHSLTVFPAFKNMVSTLAHLDGKGSPVAGVSADFYGMPRDPSHPDIGAVEFTAEKQPWPAGSYPVGSGEVFVSPKAAVDSLMERGISGTVTLEIKPGIYNEQLSLPGEIPGASAGSPVTFTRTPSDTSEVKLTWTAAGSADNFLVKLNGADFYRFDHLTFETSGSSYTRIFHLTFSSDSLEITRCKLISPVTLSENANTTQIYWNSMVAVQSMKIDFNQFTGGSVALNVWAAVNSSKTVPGISVTGNIFLGQSTAMYIDGFTNTRIHGNLIASANMGISVQHTDGALDISANKVTVVPSGQYIYGIYAGHFSGNASGNFIANNTISIQSNNGPTTTGLYLTSVSNVILAYNTVWVGVSNSGSTAIDVNWGSNLQFFNNIALNTGGGWVKEISGYSTTSNVPVSDYNLYYGNSSYPFYYVKTMSGLSDVVAMTGLEQHSVSFYPALVNMQSNLSHLDGAGIPIAGLTTDINGNPRDPSHPDIGAYEFSSRNTPYAEGTYMVGTGRDFESFQAAADSLLNRGIAGPVVLQLESGLHTGQVLVKGTIAGSSSRSPVTFGGADSDSELRYTATGSSDNFLVKSDGADFLRFDGLKLTAAGSANTRIFDLNGGSDSLEITNCILTSPATATNSTANVQIFSGTNSGYSFRKMMNNQMTGGSAAIYTTGSGTFTTNPKNTLIQGNTIQTGYYGIYLNSGHYTTVSQNTVVSGTYGIYAGDQDSALVISGNSFRLTGIGPWGIYVTGTACSATLPAQIVNNFVTSTGTGNSYGIETENVVNARVDHNSVYIGSAASSASRAYYDYNGTGIRVRNNLMVNLSQGYGFYRTYNQITGIQESDYNLIYTPSGKAAWYGNANRQTLADLQAISGMEAHSVSALVTFSDAANGDLHLAGASIGDHTLAGIAIEAVNVDIDGEERNLVSPYMGADENTEMTLPVELVGFELIRAGKTVIAKWKTISETDNAGFYVETEGKMDRGWKTEGFVAGAGTSTETHAYQFEIKNKTGGFKVRLRQVDADGNESYSGVLVAEGEVPSEFSISDAYPNPFNPTTSLMVYMPARGILNIQVIDLLGRKIQQIKTSELEPGEHSVNVDFSGSSSGVYFIKIQFGKQILVKKVQLVR